MLATRTLLLLVFVAQGAPLSGLTDDEGATYFRDVVHPILEANCLECHGSEAKRIKGGLLMDSTGTLLAGGDSGPAIVPGDPDASLLIQAVRYDDPLLEMPPAGSLQPEQVVALEHWVEQGAPWPLREAPRPRHESTDAAPGDEVVDVEEHAANKFFEEDIRPLLAAECFECHGPDAERVKSGLRMTGRDALLQGGERGPAIVPGDPDESLLARAIGYTDQELRMPPPGRLPDADVELLRRWIALGAPWPDDGRSRDEGDEDRTIDIERGRSWWSFRKVERPPTPTPARADFVANDIDAFVLARLELEGLEPAPIADDRELVRRATFDLVGLPPTVEEVEAYVADQTPDKWARLVDRLLARPEYGERWGRAWLDVMRFAQTSGYERDQEKPYIWRYRDYVIRAFNEDKPYDRFLIEQLAGDELERVTNDSQIATGFYHLGVWDSEPDDRVVATYDGRDDVLRTIGEGMMGVTVGCARCHDHKFDPIRQTDYYSMLAFVSNVRPYKPARYALDSETHTALDLTEAQRVAYDNQKRMQLRMLGRDKAQRRTEILAAHRDRIIQERMESMPSEVRIAYATPVAERSPEQRALLPLIAELIPESDEVRRTLSQSDRNLLYRLTLEKEGIEKSFEGNLDWAATVSEFGRTPRETNLLIRGNPRSPGPTVWPAFLPVLCEDERATRPRPTPPPDGVQTSGLRLALAEWITSPEHPTTARTIVNRVWQGHFGRGIVPTPNDLGSTGLPPSHPELLDWLASELVANGWSLKELHRLIMASRTYRMSSRITDSHAAEIDPGNALLWRQNLRRLDAEAVRDSMLAVSGSLNLERGGRGFFPELSREALAGASKPGEGWETSSEEQRNRRSVYAYVKRGMLAPMLEVLDFANPSLPTGVRQVTTTPSQALTLLNSNFMGRQAAALGDRVRAEVGDEADRQVERLFELAFARRPDDTERSLALDYLRQASASLDALPKLLRIRPRVPDRLENNYVSALPDDGFLDAPREGWTHLRGLWGNNYNETLEVDRARGPSILRTEPVFADGLLRARVALEEGCEFASLHLRATIDGDALDGIEVRLAATGEIAIIEHIAVEEEDALGEAVAPASRELARNPVAFEADSWHDVGIELSGQDVCVQLDGTIVAEASVATTGPGGFGVSTWGGTLRLDRVEIVTDEETLAIEPDAPGAPRQRALQALALAVLNLNEFVYVD